MLSPLMMDPKIGWLQPEQKGPAHETWSKILEEVASQTNSEHLRGREFIPLNSKNSHETTDGTALKNMINTGNCHASKKQRFENPPPWRSKDKWYPDGAVGLHIEILDFYEYMKPRPAEQAMRQEVVRRVQEVITSLWPTAQVEVYGSFRTDLYLPTSDIDLVVLGKWERPPLWTLEKALTANSIADSSSVKVLDKASVPIIKLTDLKTNIKVDISFNVPAGLKAAEFVKDQVKLFPCLPPLVFVLKQFLLQRDLNEVFTGGISSYSLILMAISFLQHHIRSEGRTPQSNLGVLLIEFLELYGHQFNYSNVGIRVKGDGAYFNKQEVLKKREESFMLLCIEDPFTEENYIGKSSYKFMDVRQAFDYAYYALSKPVLQDINSENSCNEESRNTLNAVDRNRGDENGSYLSRIVKVSDDVVDYRDWVARCWSRYTAPVITHISQPPPTYASIANKHIQPNVVKTHGMSSQDMTRKSATWPLSRSQSNAETLVLDSQLVGNQVRQYPSADSLAGLAGGIEVQLHTNTVWSKYSVRKLANSLAEENSTKRKTGRESNSGKSSLGSKSTSSNSMWTSYPQQDTSYSGVTKQSLNSPSKQSSATSARTTSTVNSVESPIKVVCATSRTTPLKKTVDEHKSLTTNHSNVSVAVSPKPLVKVSSNLCKENGGGKHSSASGSSTSSKTNNNNNNIQNNNNHKSQSSGPKSPTRQKHGKTSGSKKGRSASQS